MAKFNGPNLLYRLPCQDLHCISWVPSSSITFCGRSRKNNNNPGLNWKCRNHNISEWRIWYRVPFLPNPNTNHPPLQEYGVTLKDILFVTHSPKPSSSCLWREAVRGVRIREDIKYLLSSAWQGIINHIQLERQIPSFGCRLLAYVRCHSHPVILVNHVLTPDSKSMRVFGFC